MWKSHAGLSEFMPHWSFRPHLAGELLADIVRERAACERFHQTADSLSAGGLCCREWAIPRTVMRSAFMLLHITLWQNRISSQLFTGTR